MKPMAKECRFECQYAKDVGMPEYRCDAVCQYASIKGFHVRSALGAIVVIISMLLAIVALAVGHFG